MLAPIQGVAAVAQCGEDLRAFDGDARARCRIDGADDEVEGCFFRVVNNGAVAYGKERIQFGKPIIKNQALQFKVADMEIKTETARQMVAHALTKMDMGLPYSKESAIAKCYASDIAMEVASEAIQMFGGYGYSREYPVEKLLRDAKIFQIFEGTNEVQRIVVANNVIGK